MLDSTATISGSSSIVWIGRGDASGTLGSSEGIVGGEGRDGWIGLGEAVPAVGVRARGLGLDGGRLLGGNGEGSTPGFADAGACVIDMIGGGAFDELAPRGGSAPEPVSIRTPDMRQSQTSFRK